MDRFNSFAGQPVFPDILRLLQRVSTGYHITKRGGWGSGRGGPDPTWNPSLSDLRLLEEQA